MKALCFTGSALVEADIPQPQPGAGEVLVRVLAAGVTPTELQWYPTSHQKNGERRARAVLGHEFSGVIAAVGKDVSESVNVGELVYGMNDWFCDGATADYCVTLPSSIASIPARLTPIEAASAPISVLTAWQGLFDHAHLQRGERVLVHGGAGAVGSYAVQLARYCGAHVITTVSARNVGFVSELGANEVLDYRAVRFEETIRDMDVILDTVGGEILARSWGVLKPGGRMVTIASNAENATDPRVKQAFFIVEPRRQQLIEAGALFAAGILRPVVDSVVPFREASTAYRETAEQKLGRGKSVIVVAEQ